MHKSPHGRTTLCRDKECADCCSDEEIRNLRDHLNNLLNEESCNSEYQSPAHLLKSEKSLKDGNRSNQPVVFRVDLAKDVFLCAECSRKYVLMRESEAGIDSRNLCTECAAKVRSVQAMTDRLSCRNIGFTPVVSVRHNSDNVPDGGDYQPKAPSDLVSIPSGDTIQNRN